MKRFSNLILNLSMVFRLFAFFKILIVCILYNIAVKIHIYDGDNGFTVFNDYHPCMRFMCLIIVTVSLFLGGISWAGVCYNESLRIVSYNMKGCEQVNVNSWKERVNNFVKDVVVPFRPAIIGLNEVVIYSEDNWWNNDDVVNIGTGGHLEYLLRRINERIDTSEGKYYVAFLIQNRCSWLNISDYLCGGGALIYDSKQVGYVPVYPLRENDGSYREITNPYLTQHREYSYYDSIEYFLSAGGDNPDKAFRAIFEFPIGSKRYFNLYLLHTNVDHIQRHIDYILSTEAAFRYDLPWYLWSRDNLMMRSINDSRPSYEFDTYPPIIIGDLNMFDLEFEQADYFLNVPYRRSIDKVLPGQNEMFGYEFGWEVVVSGKKPARFTTLEYGYACMENRYTNPYSDHSPSMAEFVTSDQMQLGSVCPRFINFGKVTTNTAKSAAVEIANTGSNTLYLNNIRFYGVDADEFDFDCVSSIAPNAVRNCKARFTPRQWGQKSAKVLISTNDPGAHEIEIRMKGEAIPDYTCTSGYEECDENYFDLCETDLLNDSSNCGACYNFCNTFNGGNRCIYGSCGCYNHNDCSAGWTCTYFGGPHSVCIPTSSY